MHPHRPYFPQSGRPPFERGMRLFVQLCCALFCFLYLFVTQREFFCWRWGLPAGEHIPTSLCAALVLTLLLWGVHRVTARLLRRLPLQLYALTAIPSTLLLALLTAYPIDWKLAVGSAVIVIAGIVTAFLVMRNQTRPVSGIRTCTRNVITLFLLFVFVGIMGNTNDICHYELRAARLLMEGAPEKAEKVGEKALESSPRLNALRALALSQQGKLPEALFNYPQAYDCRSLLLTPDEAAGLGLSPDSLYGHLGCQAFTGDDARAYFDEHVRPAALEGNPAARDYRLCALLLDKDIDLFAQELHEFYPTDITEAPLPKLYREALTLYQHIRTKPLYLYEDSVSETDYEDFEALRRQYSDPTVQRNMTRRKYGDTYWWFYVYGHQDDIAGQAQ